LSSRSACFWSCSGRIALRSSRRATAGDLAIAAAIVLVGLLLEQQMGRTPFYKNGPVRVWSGDITSDQNSQQISDPYTFTHVIHGAAFYGLTRLVPATRALGPAVIAAVTLETAWEVYENTNQVINAIEQKRCRSATTATACSTRSSTSSPACLDWDWRGANGGG
jgi:hypothetical protein